MGDTIIPLQGRGAVLESVCGHFRMRFIPNRRHDYVDIFLRDLRTPDGERMSFAVVDFPLPLIRAAFTGQAVTLPSQLSDTGRWTGSLLTLQVRGGVLLKVYDIAFPEKEQIEASAAAVVQVLDRAWPDWRCERPQHDATAFERFLLRMDRAYDWVLAVTTPVARLEDYWGVGRGPVKSREYGFCGVACSVHAIWCNGDGWSAFASMVPKGNLLWVTVRAEARGRTALCQLRLFRNDVATLIARGPGHCIKYQWKHLAVIGMPIVAYDGEELLIFDRRMTEDALGGCALRIPLKCWEWFFEERNVSDKLEGWTIRTVNTQ